MKTLSQKIQGEPLTEAEVDAFVALFGERCRDATKAKLRRRVTDLLGLLPDWGIYRRVRFPGDGTVDYCAGQSYPDEVREVRRLVLKG